MRQFGAYGMTLPLITAGVDPADSVANILLESGDDLLTESGDFLLMDP